MRMPIRGGCLSARSPDGIILVFKYIDGNSHETLHWDGFGSIQTRR